MSGHIITDAMLRAEVKDACMPDAVLVAIEDEHAGKLVRVKREADRSDVGGLFVPKGALYRSLNSMRRDYIDPMVKFWRDGGHL